MNPITYHSIEVGGMGHEFKSLEELQNYYKNFPDDTWKYVLKAFCMSCKKQRIIRLENGNYLCSRCDALIENLEVIKN